MSSGSWLGDGTQDIGSKPNHMGAWEKLQLGWLNYELASAGAKSEHKLGPSMTNTKQAQGLIVTLPKKQVTTKISDPFAGAKFYYSGMGDNLDNLMPRPFTLPAGAQLSAMVKYNIELDWDYAYLVVSTDGGANWTPVATNLSTSANPNGQNFGNGITGRKNNWTALTADLSAFTGNVLLGFRYWTDGAETMTGFMVDEINVTGAATDGAETDAGWIYKPAGGFRVSTGTESRLYSHYYVAEYRTYKGFDATLQTGPYNFGWTTDPVLFNKVEHFPYQDGLLINYWDTSQTNNQTARHPGAGLLLPIDAHPKAMFRSGNILLRNRIQSYDATFGLEATDALTLHFLGVEQKYPSLKAVSVFDDRNSYYDAANPQGSVKNPNTNTQIRVKSVSAQDGFMQVEVRPAK
jgi:immune inhibitor A